MPEQEITEQKQQTILLDTANEILTYRIKTSNHDRRYIRTQEEKLRELSLTSYLDTNSLDPAQSGLLLETLFFIKMQDLGIPITCSTGQEDMQGIDFFLFDDFIPTDVTTTSNPGEIASKIQRDIPTTIFIPKFPKQQVVSQHNGRQHILQAYFSQDLANSRYLETMININTEFKQILTANLLHQNWRYPEFRIKKVKNKDIGKLDKVLHRFSRVFEQLQ